jgi:hypothetical protein
VSGFDPERGRLFAAPPDEGQGSWAGAPGLFRDGEALFVTYRLRRPQPTRGYEMRVAVVRGERLVDLARITKQDLQAESIERAALVRVDGRWRLYIGYVALADRKWCVGLVETAALERIDARGARTVLHPDAVGMSAVKDPWIRRVGDVWWMFVSCGRPVSSAAFHSTGDALSTGATKSETGLATSRDGVTWEWQGIVLGASDRGWDRSTSRLTAAVRDGRAWIGYYDGAASLAENYEERCGVVRSEDLRTWQRVSVDGPEIGTPRGPGGVRYVAATDAGDIFWEHTRADGSHELRGIVARI